GLDSVAEGTALDSAKVSLAELRQEGRRQEGVTGVDTISLVSKPSRDAAGDVTVQIYACVDVSDVDIVDSSGRSLIEPSLDSRFPFIATVILRSQPAAHLVTLDDFWTGQSFCD